MRRIRRTSDRSYLSTVAFGSTRSFQWYRILCERQSTNCKGKFGLRCGKTNVYVASLHTADGFFRLEHRSAPDAAGSPSGRARLRCHLLVLQPESTKVTLEIAARPVRRRAACLRSEPEYKNTKGVERSDRTKGEADHAPSPLCQERLDFQDQGNRQRFGAKRQKQWSRRSDLNR